MPIDARIALGVQPIKLPNPLAQAAQVAQLQGATSQNMLAQLQLGKAQRENADEMAIRDVLASGVDLTTPAGRNALVQKVTQVSPTKGFALQEQMDKRAKAELDVKKIQSEIDKTTLERFAVMANADPAGALNWLQQQNPALAAPISSAYRTLQSANGGNNQQAIRELVFSLNPNVRAAATATAPKPNLQSFGGAVGNVRTDPLSGQVLSTETVGPVTQAPGTVPEFLRLADELKKLPPNDPQRKLIEDRLRVLTTRQPAVNVYSGSLTAGVDEQGRPVFAQPSGRPGVSPRIVEGVFPPERADQRKAATEAAQAGVTLQNVETRIKRMGALLQSGSPVTGSVAGPAGMAARLAETATGIVSPNVPTPALDYQNEMRLLLSDVRKLVEKDPNLSKDEREALYETLGGGILQTPGSALRTLNNVLDKVRGGAARGPATTRPTRGPQRGAVEQGYRFKGGDPSKSENWEKV